MPEVKITISDQLQSLAPRLTQAIETSHEQSARETVNEVRHEIVAVGAVASFSFLNSIEKQFENRGAVQAWLAGSTAPHAPFVEYGRRPGKQPPVDAITRWIALKPIEIGDRKIRSVAFAIARRIGKRGIKPRFPFRRAVEAMTPRVGQIFEERLTTEINR